MTSPRLLLHSARVATPWANGGGVTYQVLAAPEGAGIDNFDWRISFADVASEGPFSHLPGVERVLVLIAGRAMTLVIDGEQHEVRPFEPVLFAGESAAHARLPHGPTADLNVMTRRGRATAAVDVMPLDGESAFVPHAGAEVIAVLEGTCTPAGDSSQPLGPRDCLLLQDGVRLQGRATLARIRLQRL